MGGPATTAGAGLSASTVGDAAIAALPASDATAADIAGSACVGSDLGADTAGATVAALTGTATALSKDAVAWCGAWTTGCFVSCVPLFGGATATGALATGGLTMTGPEGAREAIAGAGGGAVTICGAWRGCGTILRGAVEPETVEPGAVALGLAGEETGALPAEVALPGFGAAAVTDGAMVGR